MTPLAISCLLVVLACSSAAAAEQPPTEQPPAQRQPLSEGPLRVWIDQFAWGGLAETALLRDAIAESQGAAVLAGDTRSSLIQLKGYQQLHKLDVYWTSRAACYAAFNRRLNATHAVSCVPGSQAITGKADLVRTTVAALGEERAFALLPRSYLLPRDYSRLARLLKGGQAHAMWQWPWQHIEAADASSGNRSSSAVTSGAAGAPACTQFSPDGLWVLKEDAHRGKGLAVVTGRQLLDRALERVGPGGHRRYVLAQQFLADQHLVAGRPYYVRLWAVLAGAELPRAFLFNGGVVVFGQEQEEKQQGQGLTESSGQEQVQGLRQGQQGQGGQRQQAAQQQQPRSPEAAGDAMIVNLWRQDRAAADPWSLGQLWAHLAESTGSSAAGEAAWAQMQAALASVFAAAVPRLRASAARLPAFQEGSFEVLGADFLVDASLRPWLVEVNFMPSLARKVLECGGPDSSTSSSSSGSSDASTTDPGSGPSAPGGGHRGACQLDNPFDGEKVRFVRALLRLLLARRDARAQASSQAEAQVAAWTAGQRSQEAQQRRPCVGAPELEQLLVMQAEAAAAEAEGFVGLTRQLWEVLASTVDEQRCSAPGQQQQAAGGAARGCQPLRDEHHRALRWLRSGGDASSLCSD